MAQVSSIADEQTSTPLSSSKSITLRISRYNPAYDETSGFIKTYFNLVCTKPGNNAMVTGLKTT